MPSHAINSGTTMPTIAPRQEADNDQKPTRRQQAGLGIEHGVLLRDRGGARIAAASHAIAASTMSTTAGKNDNVVHFHAVERMLDEDSFYPPDDKRRESPDYRAIHIQMVIADDLPCLVCGVRHSTLGDLARNRIGATQMETHHHVIEPSLADAIEADKFNALVRPGLLRAAQRRARDAAYADKSALYKTFDAAYAADMDIATIRRWIDNGADNLRVLCDVHHRHKQVGIRAVTHPIWGAEDLFR